MEAIRNKNAVTTSHALNIAGGSEFSTFSLGAGYQYQDGVFGNVVKSDYRRFTFRINSEHILLKSGDRNVVKVGENVYYAHKQNQGIQIGNQYANALSNMLRANPCIPIYNKDGELFDWEDIQASGTEGWQNYNSYSANPILTLVSRQNGNNKSVNYQLNATAYIEVQPIKNLTYRGQINYNHSSFTYRNYEGVFNANGTNSDTFLTTDKATTQIGTGWGWSTTNTLNYKFDLLEKNHFDVLVGTEYGQSRPEFGFDLSATSTNSVFQDMAHAYMSYMKNNTSASVSGKPYADSRSMSYFGRVNYDFSETYMLSAIIRGDGNSKFAPGQRWGYFPSFSAGWVVSNEKFMEKTQSWLSFLKLLAGWGQNGNAATVDNFQWMGAFTYGALGNYSFGNNKDGYTSGAYSSRLPNADLTWETSEQLNIGFDARFLDGRLSTTFDWYSKKTKNLLVEVPVDATTFPFGQGWGAGPVAPNLVKDWKAAEPNDMRLEATIQDWTTSETYKYGGWSDFVQETDYYGKKLAPISAKNADVDGGYSCTFENVMYPGNWDIPGKENMQLNNIHDLVLIRFADVLLMQSELKQDMSGINRVRARAGLSPVPGYSLEALQNERRWELACEGLRWNDIRRWHIAAKALDKQLDQPTYFHGNPDTNKSHNGGYSARYKATAGFFKMPDTQIAMGAVKQNAGWTSSDSEYQGW